jgi:hypothetical protein
VEGPGSGQPEDESGFDFRTQWRLVEDAVVVDSLDEPIGVALAFLPEDPPSGRPDYVLVERGIIQRKRFYIPVDEFAGVRDGKLILNSTVEEAEQNGWDRPPRQDQLTDD